MQAIEATQGVRCEIFNAGQVKIADGIVWKELKRSFKVLNIKTNLFQYFAKTRNSAKHPEVKYPEGIVPEEAEENVAPILHESGNWMLAFPDSETIPAVR